MTRLFCLFFSAAFSDFSCGDIPAQGTLAAIKINTSKQNAVFSKHDVVFSKQDAVFSQQNEVLVIGNTDSLVLIVPRQFDLQFDPSGLGIDIPKINPFNHQKFRMDFDLMDESF